MQIFALETNSKQNKKNAKPQTKLFLDQFPIYLSCKSLLPGGIFCWTFLNLEKKVNPWTYPETGS